MYQQKDLLIGKYRELTVYNETSGNSLSILINHGGAISNLTFSEKGKAHEIIDGLRTKEDIEINSWYKSSILIPFPNRLKDGAYQYNGKKYYFDINNGDTGNALHGFSDFYNMQLDTVELKEREASIYLSTSYDGSHQGYPFPLKIQLVYTITDQNELNCLLKVQNHHHQTIPFGTGWHPYWTLGGDVKDWELKLPKLKEVEIDDRMIPTGILLPYNNFQKPESVSNTKFDNCFYLLSEEDNEVYLNSKKEGITLKYWQETGEEKFNYLQIFIPPMRHAIALEPMTCNVDAFNNEDGLIHLAPNAWFEGRFGVQLTAISEGKSTISVKEMSIAE